MARYDRTFLVPYLQDICALHLAKKKINERIEESVSEIERIQQEVVEGVCLPLMEEHKTFTFGHMSGAAIWGLVGLVVFAMCLSAGMGGLVAFLLITYGGIGFGIYLFISGRKENRKIDERNERRKAEYEMAKVTVLEETEDMVGGIRQRIEFFKSEIAKIDDLLQKLYSANVIPRWYRDIYPAVYLDDWFSNGRSDDLDMALNTFVLEQIKEKLDVIIKNQTEELLNQRIIIANQYKAMEQAERHHAALMNKLDEIQTLDEERNTYLSMISANTATSAFFAEATYLRY